MESTVSAPDIPSATSISTTNERGRLLEFYTALVVLLGATSICTGIIWDISWHMTIGRDTFWTPAHMAIYVGGAVAGMISGGLAIWTTFFSDAATRSRAVNFWGGRAPFGAWVAIWGAVAMISSGPFDDWWHNAYGLDVKIISPPHIVLFLGIFSIVLGALLLLLRGQNQWTGRKHEWAKWAFVYMGGIMLGMFNEVFLSQNIPNRQHSSEYYLIASWTYPFILLGIARASKLRWAATATAASFMVQSLTMIWLLPLFEASPRLGPIYNPVTHMVPHSFPALLIVPALGIDLVKNFGGLGRGWTRDLGLVVICALVYLGLLLPIQWNFSAFLLSPPADNWFFVGNRYWAYTFHGGPRRFQFWGDANALELGACIRYLITATIAMTIGQSWGNWMVRVKR